MDIREATQSYERWLARHTRAVAADLRLKHERMAASALLFLRGTFYRWAQQWPEACPELAGAPLVLAVGDLHVENFGTWRDAEGRLVWGINDVDEAWRLPYTNDLTRLATSALLAIKARRLAASPRDACDAILEGYRRALELRGRPFVLEERHGWLREIALGKLRDRAKFWDRLDALPTARGAIPIGVLRSTLPDRRLAVRVVSRPAGVGSLGRRRFVALATAHGARIAREAKALVPSAMAWATGRARVPSLCEVILQHAVRDPDPFFIVRDGWIVRRLSPHCSRIDLTDLSRERDEWRLLRAMGLEAGNIHLGSRAPVAADLRGRRGRWLEEAALTMARLVEKEWRLYARI
jgi:uncharacterized protein DUF2252